MKNVILILVLLIFLSGCAEQIDKTDNIELIPEEIETQPPTTPKEIEEIKKFCPDYDGYEQECLLHEECEWTSEENICEPADMVEDEDEIDFDEGDEDDERAGFASELEKELPDTIPNQICKKLPLTNELNPGDRLYCLALVNHDAKFCEKIDDEENAVNICFAHAKADSSYCKKIKEDSAEHIGDPAKHVCYYMLAVSSENADFCSEIDYSQDEKEQCYFSFMSNLYWFDQSEEIKAEYCSQLGDADEKTCLALKSRDVSLCKNNVNCLTFFEQPMSFCTGKENILESCIRDRAMTSKDLSICETLTGEKRDDCIGDFCTHIQLDTAICDKIKNEIEKQSRYVEVAMNLGNGVRKGD